MMVMHNRNITTNSISQHKFAKFVGKCNEIDRELNQCLKNERKQNQTRNLQQANERREQVQRILKEKKAQQQQ